MMARTTGNHTGTEAGHEDTETAEVVSIVVAGNGADDGAVVDPGAGLA